MTKPTTVRELISLLENFHDDIPVFIDDMRFRLCDVVARRGEVVMQRGWTPAWKDGIGTEAVILERRKDA